MTPSLCALAALHRIRPTLGLALTVDGGCVAWLQCRRLLPFTKGSFPVAQFDSSQKPYVTFCNVHIADSQTR